MFTFTVISDGGCRGNGTSDAQMYGSWCINGARETRHGAAEFGLGTNNQAEYRAIIRALQDLKGVLGGRSGQFGVRVLTDSELVVQQVRGTWATKGPQLRTLRIEVLELAGTFGSFEISWVPRDEVVKVLGH